MLKAFGEVSYGELFGVETSGEVLVNNQPTTYSDRSPLAGASLSAIMSVKSSGENGRRLYLGVYDGSNWAIQPGTATVATTYPENTGPESFTTPETINGQPLPVNYLGYAQGDEPAVPGDIGICGFMDGSGHDYWGIYRVDLTVSRDGTYSEASVYFIPWAW